MKTEYSLIIDTDQYAGSFERETTAYCLGAVGDCGVGVEEAEIAHEEESLSDDFLNSIRQVPDEHGIVEARMCYRDTKPNTNKKKRGGEVVTKGEKKKN